MQPHHSRGAFRHGQHHCRISFEELPRQRHVTSVRMHPLHRRIGALCGGVPHHFHRLIITTAPSCVLQVHTRVRQVWSKKRSAKAGGARRSQERGPGWSEPRDTRAAIAAPWVAVEGFGTMDLKVTAFDAVLYEGASRGIPTTKLHSMYSRMLATAAAVGAGHSNCPTDPATGEPRETRAVT